MNFGYDVPRPLAGCGCDGVGAVPVAVFKELLDKAHAVGYSNHAADVGPFAQLKLLFFAGGIAVIRAFQLNFEHTPMEAAVDVGSTRLICVAGNVLSLTARKTVQIRQN